VSNAQSPPEPQTKVIARFVGPADKDKAQAHADFVLEAGVNAAVVAAEYYAGPFGEQDLGSLAATLAENTKKLDSGDLAQCEAMLLGQAHALQAIFVNLSRRAVKQEYLRQWEAYIRVALKAQSQCRATLETLANIKNPPTVFARQANIAHGPQQVNNGTPALSRAGETENPQNEQSRGANELLPDGGASQAARRVDTQVGAVGEIDRTQVGGG
jgi:hypothetical protein